MAHKTRLSIARRVGLAFALLFSLLAACALLALAAQRKAQEAEQWTLQTHQLIAQTRALLTDMVNMETGARGYLVSGRDHFLEPWRDGRVRFEANWRQAWALAGESPAQRERLLQLQAHQVQYQQVAEALIAMRHHVNMGTRTRESLEAQFAKGQDKAVMDAFRQVQAAFELAEHDTLRIRQAQVEDWHQLLRLELALGLAAGLMACLVMARQISRPIADAAVAVEDAAQDRDGQPLAVRGPPEVRRLLAAVNRMQEHLARTRADLQATAREARQSTIARNHFLATLGHEISAPLDEVQGIARALSGQDLPPAQAEAARRLTTCGKTLQALVTDIVQHATLDTSQVPVQRQPIALRPLVEEVRQVFALRVQQAPLDLSVEVDEAVPREVVTDRLRLRQILVNLLANGLKFTPRGFVRLHVGVQGDAGPEASLAFRVEDSGIGLEAAAVERLFEQMARRDGPAAGSAEGTGLGLAISREQARLLGGDILAARRRGEAGSVFTLRLPLVRALP